MRHAVPAIVLLAYAAASSLAPFLGPLDPAASGAAAAWAGPQAARAATSAATSDAFGPDLGNVQYRGELKYGPAGYDTDEFSSRLARGERLSARIVSPFQSPLFPTLELVGPDGTVRSVDVRSRGYGKRLEFDGFVVPETGRWTVRVGSILQTQGKYAITFAIRAAPPARIAVGPDEPGTSAASADLDFDAVAGSSVEIRANAGRHTNVSISALVDPSGADVAGESGPAVDSAFAKKGVVALRVPSLGVGDGTYRATFTAGAGHDGFSAVARVEPPARPRGTKWLVADEPWIEPLTRPIRGVHERSVRIRGLHFPSQPVPTVQFGGIPGTDVLIDPYGTYIDVAPPPLPEGGTYSVAVVLADGQAMQRDDYFYYVPTPRADAIVDRAGGPVVGGSTVGGRTVRIRGANFQTGIFLRFGESKDVLPLILADDLIEVVTPPHDAGSVEVRVLDAYIHDVVAAVRYEYKDAPVVSFAPYTPTTFSAGVITPVVLAGGNFERSDTVLFDGVAVATAWISDSRLTFTVPPSSAGPHTVAVLDRLGSIAVAPPILVQ
ncbi:MAG: IPT/TIG domain-containing protein [Planctomycetes bacterium]|nr:IPT/TIG domain-containing protein [Planctomycetota bacterium]